MLRTLEKGKSNDDWGYRKTVAKESNTSFIPA